MGTTRMCCPAVVYWNTRPRLWTWGASHQLGAASPFLGDCVDADNGAFQDTGALADDSSQFGITHGACATAGDDEDGVALLRFDE